MAKIKIVGLMEMLSVPNEDLKQFAEDRKNNRIGDKEYVQLGNWGGQANEVKSWILDGEGGLELDSAKSHFEWLDYRKRILAMTPKARAEENISYISLIYWAYTGKDLKQCPIMLKSLLEVTEKFFTENSRWIKPPLRIFKGQFENERENLKINQDEMHRLGEADYIQAALRIIENCERAESGAVEYERRELESLVP